MGARWPWHAQCEAGHTFSGFSGGSDGVCEAEDGCEAAVEEYRCYRGMWGEDSGCPLDDDYVAPVLESPLCSCGQPHVVVVSPERWERLVGAEQ